MTMIDKDFVKLLKSEGWKLDRVRGSHHVMIKGSQTISVPVHGKSLKPGMLHSLLKQAGLK